MEGRRGPGVLRASPGEAVRPCSSCVVAITFVDQKKLALAVLAGTAASIVELTCGGLNRHTPGFHPLQFPPLRCRDRYEPGPVQRGRARRRRRHQSEVTFDTRSGENCAGFVRCISRSEVVTSSEVTEFTLLLARRDCGSLI
ncbi:unnamed protein product [Gadus morhua 'NCC']